MRSASFPGLIGLVSLVEVDPGLSSDAVSHGGVVHIPPIQGFLKSADTPPGNPDLPAALRRHQRYRLWSGLRVR